MGATVRLALAVTLACSLPGIDFAAASMREGPPAAAGPSGPAGGVDFARPRMRFEPNAGQTDPTVRFTARGAAGTAFLTGEGVVLRIAERGERGEREASARRPAGGVAAALAPRRVAAAVRIRPARAGAAARVEGLDPLPGVSNYLVGDDPSRWRTNVPGFARVRYESVYPGVDAVYYGNGGNLEYDFVVAPGADARQVALEVDGADRLDVDASGDLVIRTPAGDVRQPAPRVYQSLDGARVAVAARYALRGPREVGFDLGDYDPRAPLVIDPEVVYATLLGGGGDEQLLGVAADASGSAVVVGLTTSADFPTVDPIDGTIGAVFDDAFVTKLAPDGSLVFSTYFGGSDSDAASSVAVDAAGAIVVAGTTFSANLPVKDALQGALAGGAGAGSDVFVARLAADGRSLLHSTYLGGTDADGFLDFDFPTGLALTPGGAAVVTGVTGATAGDFPLASAVQTRHGGGFDDLFLSVVDASGSALLFSTYLGGDGDDNRASVAVDPETGDLAVGLVTTSQDFPAGPPRQGGPSGSEWLLKLRPAAAGTGYAVERAQPLRLGSESYFLRVPVFFSPAGLVYGAVDSGSVVPYGKAGVDARFTALDRDLDFVTYRAFGGRGEELASAAAVGADGAVYMTGSTTSTDLPTRDPIQAAYAGGERDLFVAALWPGSYAVAFATYLGVDAGSEYASAIAVDPQGNIYVAGGLNGATGFPTTPGAPQTGPRGPSDGFLVKLSALGPAAPDFALRADPPSVTAAPKQKGQVSIAVDRVGGFAGPVTVTAPDTRVHKIKLTPASASTSGDRVVFNYKVKKKARATTLLLDFTGRDAEGRERTATLSFTVQ